MNSLRDLIDKGTTVVPGAFNAASALLAESLGFEAVYISGGGLSASQGLPDTGVLSLDEVARLASYITKAVDIPAILDADTGFGGPEDAARTAVRFIEIGAKAIQIEDQEFPKRCGHLPGKSVVPASEFEDKIRAVASVRSDPEFLIIARTDARAVEGIDGAMERARRYLKAGADVIFPEALESRDEFELFAKEVNGPLLANMTEFGKTPYISADEFREMGYPIVIFPMTCFRVAMKGIEEALKELKATGTQKGLLERMQTRQEFYRLIGYTGK